MRNPIVRALVRVLNFILWTRRPKPGRHTARYLAQHASPTPVPPEPTLNSCAWSRPWTGPSAELARSIFRAEEAQLLTPECRERFFATAWAERGYDYPYTASTGVHQVRVRTAAVAA
ncbi:hypothetical protein [Streptomyces albipurpureus]|uniref:Uncharacterized protein n=1 Tax=Streptomyces albipurpureus TaxID=2897419 RepID=A0ABT0ULM5_9ACTN|nr:hypothetical protein [Streptomyces sp. CWNU-1]MCM2389355.1 hypothetical protein [Streptomyces sp. CWNU-1]